MSETVVYVRTTRAQLRAVLARIPAETRSGSADANALMVRCGLTALGRIKQAFIVKANGGTDEAGDRWPPLSPATIAYRRRHPGLPPAKIRAASRPSWALSQDQKDMWWAHYGHGLTLYKGDKGSAAKRAWAILKGAGATTLIEKYGTAKVQILRDTGLLLNSLSPGVVSDQQIFRVVPGQVIVGTNRKGAADHHEGRGNCPLRRLWPEPSRWPSNWWLDILEQARAGLVDLTVQLVRGI